jgi:hypothetical protein
VKPDVAPSELACTGELMISSRDGTGRLGEQLRLDPMETWRTAIHLRILSPDLRTSTSLHSDLGAERVNLINDETLHAIDGILLLEAEVKWLDRTTLALQTALLLLKLTVSQIGSSAGSCQTCRYGWLRASSQLIRLAGSKQSI